MDLFVECFEEDSYYRRIFPNEKTRAAKMKECFFDAIFFCVNRYGAYGIYDNEILTAFILFFDYHHAKAEYPGDFKQIFGTDRNGELRYSKEIHNTIEKLNGVTIYILSLGVAERRRKQGLASKLIDSISAHYPHCYLAADISNENSLEIYRRRAFAVETIEDSYFLAIKKPRYFADEIFFCGKIKLVVPDTGVLSEALPSFRGTPQTFLLSGYEKSSDRYVRSFVQNIASENTPAYVYELTYGELLAFQRYINVSHYAEIILEETDTDVVLLYSLTKPHDGEPLVNSLLARMLPAREKEWSIIPDLQVLFPVEYDNAEVLRKNEHGAGQGIMTFMNALDFRTHYESGVPKGIENMRDMPDVRERIRRLYLGKIKIKIAPEISFSQYTLPEKTIGHPAYVDLLISIDVKSNSGVVSLVSLSTPFLISHLMDNIIRNQLFVCDSRNEWVNLFAYLSSLGVFKRGTPKMCLTVPCSKDCLDSSQTASLLMAETIYASNEELGRLIDGDILQAVNSEPGMGQYDRAFVCASSNVLLQFLGSFQRPLAARMIEESISHFYIELLMFEEAAIQIANNSIVRLLAGAEPAATTAFLRAAHAISKNYTKTMVFWDVQMNYPSSKKSMDMLREAFKIRNQVEYFKRNQEELQVVFDTKRDLIDRLESTALNYIILFLTAIQAISIIVPVLFTDARNFPYSRFIGLGLITLMIVIYRQIKKITLRRLFKTSMPPGL
jgi:ribosomal protein S18 acetylase RimI-like enzyme